MCGECEQTDWPPIRPSPVRQGPSATVQRGGSPQNTPIAARHLGRIPPLTGAPYDWWRPSLHGRLEGDMATRHSVGPAWHSWKTCRCVAGAQGGGILAPHRRVGGGALPGVAWRVYPRWQADQSAMTMQMPSDAWGVRPPAAGMCHWWPRVAASDSLLAGWGGAPSLAWESCL